MFTPACLPLLIGSLPLVSHREAVELILKYTPEIPLWPQLPKLPKEGMIRQFVTGLPGLVDDEGECWLNSDVDGFTEEMASFYQDYLEHSESPALPPHSRFALRSDTAHGFTLFLQMLSEKAIKPIGVKGQVTGPMTTGIGIKDQHDKPIFYDDNLRDIVTRIIALKARWQVEQLQEFSGAVPPLIFIDEPGMVSFGSTAYATVSREMVAGSVEEVIREIKSSGGLAGVHICANGDWEPVLESEADLISFDAYSFFDNFVIYKSPLLNFIQRGGLLVWGIIPTGDPLAVERETTETLFAKWEQQAKTLVEMGIDFEALIKQTFIAPSCGTGSLTIDQAMKVLSMTRALSTSIRNRYRNYA